MVFSIYLVTSNRIALNKKWPLQESIHFDSGMARIWIRFYFNNNEIKNHATLFQYLVKLLVVSKKSNRSKRCTRTQLFPNLMPFLNTNFSQISLLRRNALE